MPTGPGYGNGTGGANGARGVVASTGFGNGVATGNALPYFLFGHRKTGRIRQRGCSRSTHRAVSSGAGGARKNRTGGKSLSKPTPIYTDEGSGQAN